MANLGSLVVSLEANMAKFQTDMQKSAAVTEQSMAKMVLSSEQAKNAVNRLESQFNKAGSAAISMGKSMLLGAAVGLSFEALASKISSVIDTMANLKTMSEKTGSSVENLSKLGFIAKQSGSDLDSVATALTKLSKGMAGADADTKGAGLAFGYLGLKAKDAAGNLKDPSEMFTEIAKKLNTYQDGAGKAAIAQAIFGKAGAEMLPTLKLLGEQGDIVAKVTDAQATAARQYTRDIAKLDAQKNVLFKTIAVALLPTVTDFSNVLLEASKDTNVLNKAAKDLSSDNSITNWADAAAMGIARLIDVLKLLPSIFAAVKGSASVVLADIEFVGKSAMLLNPALMAKRIGQGQNPMGDISVLLAQRNKTLADANTTYDKLWNMEGNATEQAMAKRIASRQKDRLAQSSEASAAAAAERSKPKPNFNTAGEGKGGGGGAGPKDDPAKKELDGKVKAQEAFIASEKTQLATREQYLKYYYDLEYTTAADYYGTKNKLIQDALQGQLDAYDKEAAATVIYLAQAKTQTQQQDARNSLAAIAEKRKVAEIASNKDLGDSVNEQNAIYRQFDLTTAQVARSAALNNAQAQFQIDLLGKGTIEVLKLTEARKIDLALEQRIYDMRLKSAPQEKIDAAIADSLLQKNAAMGMVEESYNRQRTAIFGATEAMRKYAESTGNQAAQVEGAMTNAFKSAEDAFANFVKTGKLGMKDFANVVIDQLIRIQAQKMVAAVASGGGDLFGSIFKTVIGAAIGGSMGGAFGAGIANALPGDSLTNFIDLNKNFASVSVPSAAGGFDIPMGMNPMTQLHQKEMVLPAEHADVIRSLSGSGVRGGGGENITIINQTSGRIDNVVSQSVSPGERQLIIQETREAVAADHYDPNSRVSRAMKNNYTAARVR